MLFSSRISHEICVQCMKNAVILEDFARNTSSGVLSGILFSLFGSLLGLPFGVPLGFSFGFHFGFPFKFPFEWGPEGPPPKGPFPKGALRIVFVSELPTAGAKSGGGK